MNISFKLFVATFKAYLLLGSYKKPMPMFSKKSLDGHQQMLEKTTSLLLPKRKTQGPNKVVTEYAKAIRKLIKRVDSGKNWTEKQKIYFFTKRLRTDLFYAFWPLLALKDNPTMDMTIELFFVSAPVIASAPQIAATFFAAQTQDPNEQLINRLTANLAQQQNRGPPVCYHCGLTGHFFRDCNNSPLPSSAPKNNDNQNNRTINNNVPNQRPNYANINFFGEDSLVKATDESASQSEENFFYAFNLTDDNYNIDKLAINTSKLTRKKKKVKIDFIIDPKKASTSTADNNKSQKIKVFKNSPKLKPSEIVQKSDSYFVVKNLMKTPAHIIFDQLMTHFQFRKNLCKSLISKKKTPKTNKCLCQAELANNSNVIPFICKAQVTGYFIDLILNSGSSVSVIAKHFLEAIGKKINEPSTKPMTNVHGDKKKSLEIAKAVSTTPPVPKQSQEKEQSDESDDKENKEEDEQKEQKEIAKLVYIIFTSNGKPLDNVKADKEEIMVNGKLICWPYYDILRRTFDRKPDKKAKYSYWWHDPCAQCWCDKPLYSPNNECMFCLIYYKNWKLISLISRKEIKEVQKSFKNEPPEI
ncbi:hypothetical protein G9A89_018053 [Geosiphon pyriformis]|nr:hypothetical protein G9A89_018053 [Geosiphon pyriformis]